MKLATAVTATATSLALAAGCSPESAPPIDAAPPASTQPEQQPTSANGPTIYLEAWQGPQLLDPWAKGALATHHANVILAFAEPTADGKLNTADIDANAASLAFVLHGARPDAAVELAIGGWGTEKTHQNILNGFEAAAQNPEAFAANVKYTLDRLSSQLGRELNGVDIDWEYPTDPEAFVRLMTALDAALPGKRISVAVPSRGNYQAFVDGLARWVNHVDAIHVMTYDEHTPYDNDGRAGPQATTEGITFGYLGWASALGPNAHKAAVGFTGICYRYDGASGEWLPAKRAAEPEVPYSSIADRPTGEARDGSSWIKLPGGNVASCTSPYAISKALVSIIKTGGSKPRVFFWGGSGVTESQIAATEDIGANK